MDWLVQALRAIRDIRDLAAGRANGAAGVGTPSDGGGTARTEDGTRARRQDMSLSIPPIGPAIEPEPPREPKHEPPREMRPAAVSRPVARISPRLLDRDAVEVVRRLRRFDHAAYIVGGCVRDLLVGLAPKDFDVSTSARPEEIRKIFRNSRIIGRRFRLAHIYFRGGKIIETSTFRGTVPPPEEDEPLDSEAEDENEDEDQADEDTPPVEADAENDEDAEGEEDEDAERDLLITRDNVWGTEEEDARRRDFTINALFYDVTTGQIIDHVGGLADVEARLIRTIGSPEIRVQEDPVRILRAARFAAKLGFAIEPRLAEAMRRYKSDIARCAKARIHEETFKLLRSGHAAQSVRVLEECEVLDAVLPEIDAHLGRMRARGEGVGPTLFDYLGELDDLVRRRGQVTDAVILGALLLAPLDEHAAGAAAHEQQQMRNEFLARSAERLAATRRIRERLRQIYAAQKQFGAAGGRRVRRRVSPAQLAKRSYFAEALDLFEVRARAIGEGVEEIKSWRRRTGDLDGPRSGGFEDRTSTPPPPQAEEAQPERPRSKRRRRRGGRGRGRPEEAT